MSNSVHVDKPRTDFFVTGNEYMRDSLDLRFIPHVNLCNDDNGGGIILADANQDLQQSCLIARSVFERTKPGMIKFVLIGLSPYNVSTNENELPVANPLDEKVLEGYFKLCVDNGAKPIAVVLPVHLALKKLYKADSLKLFRDMVDKVANEYKANFIDLLDAKISDNCFKDKTHLNSDGSAAISALLGAKLYFAKVVSLESIVGMDNDFFNEMLKYFPDDCKNLIHHTFCKMACDDFKRLSKTLPKENCLNLMTQVFSVTTYDHLAKLSDMLSKNDYNDLADRIFKVSVEKIRRKDKIKVGFVVRGAAEWCGDDLYNFFAKDERFKPTIFIHPQVSLGNETLKKEFWRGVEQFKQHGLNVVALNNLIVDVPTQDVLIFLTPYFDKRSGIFNVQNMLVKNLVVYIPYGFHSTKFNEAHHPVVWTAWKAFLSSALALNLYTKKPRVGMPRGFYSGYPRMDIFFKKDMDFRFDWKLTHPDAKKLIWAPHWSINRGVKYATFQWNYQFMYEFAKAHSEISWIVKPHPILFRSAVSEKVFPNVTALEKYLRAWNDLPNAQVYTGAYYQAIFATSDGLIQDCGSFTAEYQYVDKPMIYLTRKGAEHNELGDEILKASYTVDGKDLEGIAAMIQRVFIDGDDYKAAKRRAVFDKYLNYPKDNGMLASEFIYKSISQDLK